MMLLAILLAAGSPCGGDLNQMQLTQCWADQAKQADAQLNKTYANVTSGLRAADMSPKPLVGIQLAWIKARDKTCAFEEGLADGGTIAPMMGWECVDRMTRARTARLQAFYDTVKAGDDILKPAPADPDVDAELNRVYRALRKQLTGNDVSRLIAAETAWIAYRDTACATEGNACMTDLEKERTEELKAGWLGEPFW